MSQIDAAMVGNDFVLPKRLRSAPTAAKIALVRDEIVPVIPVEAVSQLEIIPVTINTVVAPSHSHFEEFVELLHRQSFIVFALLILLVAASGIEVGGRYWEARLTAAKVVASVAVTHDIAGLNLTVPAAQLDSRINSIISQSATLKIGDQNVGIGAGTIKSWLKITPSADKSQDYIHISSQTMAKSLTTMAQEYAVAPVNQVTVTHGGVSQVVVAGQNGAKLTDPGTLTAQSASLAKSVMNGNGLNFSTPLLSQPYQSVTPAAFSKLIEVNVDTHQMYLYDNGNLTSTYAISAGAPATPTPIGEFHIWEKLAEQTMKGFNPNGTPYVQPNVQWINYFDHSGDAVHGNYWRPLSVFGAVNTSHGCVSLPNGEAKVVYDWAPIGTTVITHHS